MYTYLLKHNTMDNKELIKQCEEIAQLWATSDIYDKATQDEVKQLLANEDKTPLIDSFYRTLEFGTGGLRGIMGAGTNRMNIYTVGAATQGLANYLKKSFADKEQISVVVGYDCRNNSDVFARTTAQVFTANGIKVYLFDGMRPTPEISFAIRHFGCESGVMLTASHNPKEYNGYKAYWNDGSQVLTPHDAGIIEEVNKVTVTDIKFEGNDSLIEMIGEEVDKIFLDKVQTLSIDPEVIKRQKDLKIVFTPLHGAGMYLIPASLRQWGFENVHTVPEQMVKDGNFPTVVSPNPENAEALTMAINLAKNIDAELVLACDPDADRIAVACRNSQGTWEIVDGNQTCMIFLYYIIRNRIAQGKMQPNDFIVKTIVTTELITSFAKKYDIKMFDVYTGFKWIAKVVRDHEGVLNYIGGGEESFGFLAESFARDKDSVSACSLLAEIGAWAKDQGKTLYDVLMDIYVEFGFSLNKTINVVKPGKSGADEIKAMMENFRSNPPRELAGMPVVLSKDFLTLQSVDAEGKVTSLDMPAKSDVLQWYMADGSKVSVRPSGTEPKIKFYIEVFGTMANAEAHAEAQTAAQAKVDRIVRELKLD